MTIKNDYKQDEFHFDGLPKRNANQLAEDIRNLDLTDSDLINFYKQLLDASIEMGGNVRGEQDNDAPTCAEITKMECSNIVVMLLDKKGLKGPYRQAALNLCQFAYTEAHRLQGGKPENYSDIMGALGLVGSEV